MRAAALAILLAACGGGGSTTPDAACAPAACAAEGKLCDGDACVDPWHHGDPVWSTCAGEPRATPESLADKAAIYEQRLVDLHLTAQHPWVLDVIVNPGVDPTTATAADVVVWRSGENDGLWTGLALAAEAYRYAATRDPAALATIRTLLGGEHTRMAITGVPGLFTRQLLDPGGTGGLECPTDPAMYVPSPEKRGNKWVRIGSDGCAQTADPGTLAFVSSSHCGLDEFAGWCFLDNVSQDEYVGHMFGLTAVARLVDDPAIRADAVGLLEQIGTHLIEHAMEFVDWDGRPTQWGKIHPGAAGDTPGYLAVMGMSFLADVATTGDPDLVAAEAARALEYPAYLDQIDIWAGPDACESNWNNISMLTANFHHLLWQVTDPARRAALHQRFDGVLMRPSTAKGALSQHNAWFDIMWAAQKPLGPGTDGPAYDAVEDAVCMLRQFPASNHEVAHPANLDVPHACDGRSGESLASNPYETADRCAATYLWWLNPYRRDACADEPTRITAPTGYLLPYWMGRYYGFIAPEL